jgi:hypothetical protein
VRDKTLPGFVFREAESDEAVGTAVTKTTEFFNCYCLYSFSLLNSGKSIYADISGLLCNM